METTKVIHLEKANTLSQFLSYQERREVVSLKITGFIGRKDFDDVLDDMCTVWGEYDDDDNFIPNEDEVHAIKHIDLGEAKYVDGEELPFFGFHTQLETFIFPQGVKTTLDKGEFETGLSESKTLKTLVLPKGIKIVAGFNSCPNITNLVIPDGVEIIKWNAFIGCKSITSIRIPSSVRELHGSSFAGCNIEAYEVDEAYECYTVVDGVVYTKDLKTLVAFPSAYPKKHFEVPSTTQIIGSSAFESAPIVSIDLPDGLTIIEKYAFEFSAIHSIEIPDGVTEIGDSTFCGCRNLEHVRLSRGLTKIPERVFSSCTQLRTLDIPMNVKYIDYSSLAWCDGLEILQLHDGLEEIGERGPMLIRDGKLREVVFPKTLKKVPGGVFNYSPYINEFKIDSANPYFCVIDGALYSKDGKILYSVPNRYRTDFIIPEGVEEIAEMAFMNMYELNQITLPSTLRIIGDRAFQGCNKVETIRLPARLDEVEILFLFSCNRLKTVIMEGHVPPKMFGNVREKDWIYEKIELLVPKDSVAEYKKAPGWRDFIVKENNQK